MAVDLKTKGRNLLINTQPACFIAVRERLPEFYSMTKLLNSSTSLTLDVIQVLNGKNYFQSC